MARAGYFINLLGVPHVTPQGSVGILIGPGYPRQTVFPAGEGPGDVSNYSFSFDCGCGGCFHKPSASHPDANSFNQNSPQKISKF